MPLPPPPPAPPITPLNFAPPPPPPPGPPAPPTIIGGMSLDGDNIIICQKGTYDGRNRAPIPEKTAANPSFQDIINSRRNNPLHGLKSASNRTIAPKPKSAENFGDLMKNILEERERMMRAGEDESDFDDVSTVGDDHSDSDWSD